MIFLPISLEPKVIAKSSIVLDVKPWDDETDMVELEKQVRSIEQDGLVWGACESGFKKQRLNLNLRQVLHQGPICKLKLLILNLCPPQPSNMKHSKIYMTSYEFLMIYFLSFENVF